MKKIFFGIVFFAIILVGCGGDNVVLPTDPEVQNNIDSLLIIDYFREKGYPLTDTTVTENGIRFFVLDKGSGAPIEENDNVHLDYIGMLLSDSIFDTSIKEVGDSIRAAVIADTVGKTNIDVQLSLLRTFSEDKKYDPLQITYSISGWSFRQRFLPGFREGLAASLIHLNVGGTVLIVIPSAQAYKSVGTAGIIEPNEVISFQLKPVRAKKQ